jgi:hypothetical protein
MKVKNTDFKKLSTIIYIHVTGFPFLAIIGISTLVQVESEPTGPLKTAITGPFAFFANISEAQSQADRGNGT